MRVTASRVGVALGLSVLLGGGGVAAQTVVEDCRTIVLLEAPSAHSDGVARRWSAAVAVAPDRTRLTLVVGGAAEPLLCLPGLDAAAAGVLAAGLSSGENVYVRGFGSFVIKKKDPPKPWPNN